MKPNSTHGILKKIRTSDPGSVFVTRDFLHLGSRAAVDQALARLVRRGQLRRLGRGLFDKPRVHPKLGVLSPSTDDIARAIARKSGAKVQVSGAQAANDLGLSLQVPARPVYLTDASSRKVKVGNRVIEFRHASPKTLGKGPLFLALRHIGRDHITDDIVDKLKRKLSNHDKKVLGSAIANSTDWMRPIVRQVTT